jgi:hypothetical protein
LIKVFQMASLPYLPLATEYVDRDALKDVRDNKLARMRDECSVWSDEMDDFRASLVTRTAVVLWRVLIAEERLLVANALTRVMDEMAERKLDEVADAVPAPGEDFRHLDGEGTNATDDNNAWND